MDIEEDTKSMSLSLNPNLEFLDILEEAKTILLTNTKLFLFSVISSFPFLFFLFYFEFVLQKTVSDSSELISQPSDYNQSFQGLYYFDTIKPFVFKWLYLCFLYLGPYYILDLVNMVAVVNKVSTAYVGETAVRFKAPFLTSLYVLFFSTCFLIGIIWVITNSLVLSNSILNPFDIYYSYYYYANDYYDIHYICNIFVRVLVVVFHSAIFVALMVKYSKWSAGWNTALVVSVLEEDEASRFDALEVSAYYIRGSEHKGMKLMLGFFLWGLVLRLPCLVWGCSEKPIGVVCTFLYVVLIWLGNVFKWVVCVVYFFDCKKRIMEKKVDDREFGKRVGTKLKPVKDPSDRKPTFSSVCKSEIIGSYLASPVSVSIVP